MTEKQAADAQKAAEKRRKSARAQHGAPRATTYASQDDVAYTAHVFRRQSHTPRGQSKRSLQNRRYRRAKRQKEYKERQRTLVERWKAKLDAVGARIDCPRAIPLKAWTAARLMRDQSAGQAWKATKIYLRQLPRHYRQKLLQAALRPKPHAPGDRKPERTEIPERAPRSRQAQRTIHFGIVLYLCSEPTSRRGFDRCVRGLGRGVFQAMLQDFTTEQRAGLSTLFGGDPRCEVPAPAQALEQTGAIRFHQPPADRATAADRGPSGWAYNVYWIRGATRFTPATDSCVDTSDAVYDPEYFWCPEPVEPVPLSTRHS